MGKEARSLAGIVADLGGELVGNGDVEIRQVASLKSATTGQIAFLAHPKYRSQLQTTAASAVILRQDAADAAQARSLPCVVSDNPYAYYARVAALLNPPPDPVPGIDPTASLHSALPASCAVGAQVSIGRGVVVGERVVIGPGCVIGDGVVIGDDSRLHARVVIREDCVVGRRAIIHPGVVIGADGFGFAPDGGRWVKIPQLGRVVIGDDVEIGANTTIDRGALDDTVIGHGVKLDNQIQIAHNVVIGDDVALAGCVGVAGSAKIGRGCTVGGGAIILGHLELAEGVHVSAGTMVTRSITRPGKYTGAYPTQDHEGWLKNAAHLRHLDALTRRLRELEDRLAAMEKQ